MSKEMVISANPHETRVAIMEEGQLCEFYVEREKEFALVGSIYKGRVTRVLPGMQSAFVDIGLDGDAFLYVSDFLEDIEEFDHIVTTVEDKVQKMEDQGGQVFAAEAAGAPAAVEPPDVEAAPYRESADSMAPPVAPPLASAAPGDSAESIGNMQPLSPTQTYSAPSQDRGRDRGRFENRGRGGRDFGRRGGRGRFGRGGRDRGGRGGGDRRYGRELPPSKYASPRPYDDHPSDSGPAEGHLSVILPGESLAKYKDRPPMSSGLASASAAGAFESASAPAPALETPPVAAAPEPIREDEPPARQEFRSSFSYGGSHGVEPLPGESISKWKSHPAHERAEAAAAPAIEHEPSAAPPPAHPREDEHEAPELRAEHAVAEEVDAEDTHGEDAHVDDTPVGGSHSHADELSEDEARAIAEHIAEAQSEEVARELQARSFAADELNGGAAEAEETEAEHAEREDEADDAEEHEDESAPEADAIAAAEHEDHSEHGDHAEESAPFPESESEALAAASEREQGSPQPLENTLPQESQPWKAQVRNDFRSRMHYPSRRGGRDRDRGDRGDRGRRDDRGRRPHHGHGHFRPQPRRTQLISDLLKQGQEIIVQIAKEPLGKKGARITSHVALPGRYLVYMPTLDHTGVSRKISSAEDRSRLRHLVNDAKGSFGGGFIVRTAAASASPDEVRADVEFLTRTWADIKSRSEQRKAPSLLHRDLNLVERILRDYLSSDYTAIWVDNQDEFTKVVDFVSRFQPALANRVKLYTKETPVFEEFGIQQEIDKGLRPKVWLKSGGYIVINHTEALVAIDVNTGKFVGKGSTRLEDTIVRTNLEAVKEIVRQMRLRDLGGIIVIDFIDMEERRNREKVMAALEDALRADRAPSKVLRFNEFGLVAITRKRTKQALERTLCQPCPYCTGSGMVKSVPTLCYEIQTEARKMAPEMDSGSLTLRVHPEIAKALKTRESSLVEELERWTKKSIIIQADPTLHWEQYDIY
jgi:Rne/Rng family ribonuclease